MNEYLRELCCKLYGIDADLPDDQIRAQVEATASERRLIGIEPETVDVEARTVEVVVATEAVATVIDRRRWEVVDEVLLMSGCRLDEVRKGKLPLLDSHQRDTTRRILGSAINLRTESGEIGQLLATEHFSKMAEPELIKTSEGHLDQRSVGYQVRAYVRIEPGESAEVEGMTYTAGDARALHVVTNWLPIEDSLVCIGADANAGTRAVVETTIPGTKQKAGGNNRRTKKTNKKKGTSTMNEQLRQACIQLGMNPEASEDEAWTFVREHQAEIFAVRAGQGAGGDGEGEGEGRRSAGTGSQGGNVSTPEGGEGDGGRNVLAEEGQRVAAIRTHFAPYMDVAGVRGIFEEVTAIGSGVDVTEARGKLYDALRKATPTAGIRVTRDEGESRAQAMEAALTLRAAPNAAATMDKNIVEHAREFRGLSLFDMCREALIRINGVSERELAGLRRIEVVGAAFGGQLPSGRTIAHTTGDFTNILANTARKVLLAGFGQINATWKEWCYVMSVSDFKSHNLNMLSGFSYLSDVPEGAEIPHHSLSDQAESVTAGTKANIFSITRQAIINDDLNAFTRVPMMQGMAWARTIERGAVSKLLANGSLATDSTALFAAGHSNLLTGTSYAPTTTEQAKAGLNALKTKIAKQTGINGEALMLMPEIILCGPTGEDYIREAVADTVSTDKDRTPNRALRNKKVAVSAYLEDANIDNYSTSAYYMFANPVAAPVVVVALLDGVEEPYLETKQGWDVDGVEYKVRGDVGFGVADYRGAALATGASA